MKKLVIVVLLVIVMTMGLTIPAHAEVTQNEKIPVTWTAYIPCTDETITLEGTMHVLYAITEDNNGTYHIKTMSSPANLKGVDSAGNKYIGVGKTSSQIKDIPGLPYESTYVNNYYMIGTGKDAPSYKVHWVNHIKIDENGEVTLEIYHERITCK